MILTTRNSHKTGNSGQIIESRIMVFVGEDMYVQVCDPDSPLSEFEQHQDAAIRAVKERYKTNDVTVTRGCALPAHNSDLFVFIIEVSDEAWARAASGEEVQS